MSIASKLNKVDDRTKYGVFGWIRKAEQELSLPYFPIMLKLIVVLYSDNNEYFDKKRITKFIKLSDDYTTIKVNYPRNTPKSGNIFGVQNISVYFNYKWTFNWNKRGKCNIGITTNYMNANPTCCWKNQNENHAIIQIYPWPEDKCAKFNFYDHERKAMTWLLDVARLNEAKIISMELCGSVLTFKVNKSQIIYQYKNINRKTLSWQMFVNLGQKSQIQLLEFEKTEAS